MAPVPTVPAANSRLQTPGAWENVLAMAAGTMATCATLTPGTARVRGLAREKMMQRWHGVLAVLSLLVCFDARAAPDDQASVEAGRGLFKRLCASCHGVGAKGDGVMTEVLKVTPADLTAIAARNNGVFDSQKVMAFIDGQERRVIAS
jgi:mono/diheme cytochrome c family protein